MATMTTTITTDEEKYGWEQQWNDVQGEFRHRIEALEAATVPEQEESQHLGDLLKWFIMSLLKIASPVGTAAGALRAVHVNAANIERIISLIGRSTDMLSHIANCPYRLARRFFPRGHGVRKFLWNIVKKLRNFDISSTGAQRILGFLQIVGSVVTLGFALSNIRKINQLARDIEESGRELAAWRQTFLQDLNTKRDSAQQVIRELIASFSAIEDFTAPKAQIMLRNKFRKMEGAMQAYKSLIGRAREALESIRNKVIREQERADELRNQSIGVTGMGAVGLFFSVASGGVPGVVSGVINAAATTTGVAGIYWSNEQLQLANNLLTEIEREMGTVREHDATYSGLVEQLHTFQQTIQDKIDTTKSEMADKDRQLAEMAAQLEALRKRMQNV